MFCNACENNPCVCLGVTAPVTRTTYMSRVGGITKEQFGLNLYETIKTIGGLLGIEQQRAAAIHYEHPENIAKLMTRRTALQVTLAAQLPTLTNDEMDAVLEKYPWITGS